MNKARPDNEMPENEIKVHKTSDELKSTHFKRKLLWGLFVMVLLLPLGIWGPALLGSGGAWGEWSTEGIKELLGYVPEGMERQSETWRAPARDYGQTDSLGALRYILSGALGAGIVALSVFLLGRFLKKDGGNGDGRDS